MTSNLKSVYTFNKDISDYLNEIKTFFKDFKKDKEEKLNQKIEFNLNFEEYKLYLTIVFEIGYPHTLLFHIRNLILKKFGRKYKLTVKEISITYYEIEFSLDKKPLTPLNVPYVDEIEFYDKKCKIVFNNVMNESFIKENYINRIVKRIKEKIEHQHYEGKGEYSEILWRSKKREIVWDKDPSKVMLEKGWIKHAETKGKYFFGPQIAKITQAMRKIVYDEILKPMTFKEVIEPHHESFTTLLKTGHLEGVPMEVYYICEPKTRNPKEWESFIDKLKISLEVPYDELMEMLSPPNAINCYVQCPNIYEFFSGKTIADEEFPILIYDGTAVSNRYESGGRHGIERMDEFHRIEIVYIGTKEQLIEVKDKLIERYSYIFNDILELEWRMAWVTPFYMQHSGLVGLDDESQRVKGTIDFETYLPYRGSRENSEWLEFQNLSIVGDKYTDAFNIKAQKLDLWSGCSGVGLERWTISFLAQKGLDPKNWPDKFRKIVGDLPELYTFY
ncbi:MAG: serine--tRNA ligase [Promethearchaeota archaeon]|nr:MAG: serine--tRNA ligase [Candidatus Lokiarchaeota archaeon]